MATAPPTSRPHRLGPQAMHAANQAEEAARAARASALVHIGELSAVGRALVSELLAPGNEDTFQQLCDLACHPNAPYAPISSDVLSYQRADATAFPITPFLAAWRTAPLHFSLSPYCALRAMHWDHENNREERSEKQKGRTTEPLVPWQVFSPSRPCPWSAQAPVLASKQARNWVGRWGWQQ